MAAPDPEDGHGATARGCTGRTVPLRPARPSMGLPRLVLLDDVLGDDDCEAVVRIASLRVSRLVSSRGRALGGAAPVHVCLDGDLNPYEAACRDHVDGRLHALFDWPREAGLPLRVTRLAGPWTAATLAVPTGPAPQAAGRAPGRAPGRASAAGAVVGLLVCWLRVARHGAWLRWPEPGLTLAARRGTVVFFRPPAGALAEAGDCQSTAAVRAAASATANASPLASPHIVTAGDASWIATKCFTRR